MMVDGTPVMKRCSVCGSSELSPYQAGSDGKLSLRCNHCGSFEPENIPEDRSAIALSDIDPSSITSSELQHHRQLLEETGPAEQTSPETEERDYQLDRAQMVKNMADTEARFQLAMDQVKSLLLERDALLNSATYQVSSAILRIASRYPKITRAFEKILRRNSKFIKRAPSANAPSVSTGQAETVDAWPKDRPLVSYRSHGKGFGQEQVTRPSILIAMPFVVIGGAERLLSAIAKHFTGNGWRVVIVTTQLPGPDHADATAWFNQSTDNIYHLPRFLARPDWIDFVRYIVEAKKVNIVLLVGSAFVYDILPWLKLSYPDLRIADLLFNTVGHTENNRKHAGAIDLHIVENKDVLAWLTERGENPSRIRLIESGVDLQTYAPRENPRAILAELSIPDDAFVVGFSGRWSEEKDPLGFIEIARLTKARNVVFLMTGTGHLRGQIETAIQKANFRQSRFHLVGPVPDVAPYIAAYDLLCLNSRLDGRPIVVLEALAMGVPVLASKVGALPDLVQEGENGWLVQPEDYERFAHLIDQLAANPQKAREMKKNARRFAEAKLDATKMLLEYAGVVRDLICASHS